MRPGWAGLREMRAVKGGGASRRQKRVVGRIHEKNRSAFQDFAAELIGELGRLGRRNVHQLAGSAPIGAVTLTTTLPHPRRL